MTTRDVFLKRWKLDVGVDADRKSCDLPLLPDVIHAFPQLEKTCIEFRLSIRRIRKEGANHRQSIKDDCSGSLCDILRNFLDVAAKLQMYQNCNPVARFVDELPSMREIPAHPKVLRFL